MERSHESAWGAPSPESGADSPSGSSKKEKSKKSGETTKAEQADKPAASQLAQMFGREVLRPDVKDEGVIRLRRAESAKDKPSKPKENTERQDAEKASAQEQAAEAADGEGQETLTTEQERAVAAEVVDEAQAQNEQEAAQASGAVEQAGAENVDRLLNNMETGLETAPPQEAAEQIIDRATEETAASLTGEGPADGEMPPLDWPGYPAGAERGADAASGNAETGMPAWQQERANGNDPDQATTAAPYVAGGAGMGGGGFRPPAGYAAGFNPNAAPPPGGAGPAAANLGGLRAKAEEVSDALARGFWTGLIGGGIIGHWLGHRHERAKAKRAMTKQERLYQKQAAKYEAQVAESEARIRILTERQAYAARQAMHAAETVPAAARAESAAAASAGQPRTAERPAAPALAEARPLEIKTNAPKRVEMMADREVHEAARDVKIGDKTLYELKENGTVTTADERTLLRLAEQGGIEDPARKYQFDQEVQRVLMRHELDPLLAQQVLQHELDTPASQGAQTVPAEPHSPLFPSAPDTQTHLPTPASQATGLASGSRARHPLVIANVVAGVILAALLLILLLISITR